MSTMNEQYLNDNIGGVFGFDACNGIHLCLSHDSMTTIQIHIYLLIELKKKKTKQLKINASADFS